MCCLILDTERPSSQIDARSRAKPLHLKSWSANFLVPNLFEECPNVLLPHLGQGLEGPKAQIHCRDQSNIKWTIFLFWWSNFDLFNIGALDVSKGTTYLVTVNLVSLVVKVTSQQRSLEAVDGGLCSWNETNLLRNGSRLGGLGRESWGLGGAAYPAGLLLGSPSPGPTHKRCFNLLENNFEIEQLPKNIGT